MKLRTTVSTTDGSPPGSLVEVPDNEAPGLIALGIMSLPEVRGSTTSKSNGDEDTEVSDEAENTTKEG